MEEVIRGSMWWASIPHDACNPHSQSGMRPVVVVSNNKCNQHSPSILVAPITTRQDKYYFIHPKIHCEKGKISYVLAEQIKVLEKELLGKYIGQVRDIEQKYIDKALATSLDLISYMEELEKVKQELAHANLRINELEANQQASKRDADIASHVRCILDVYFTEKEQAKLEEKPVHVSDSSKLSEYVNVKEVLESHPFNIKVPAKQYADAIDKFNAQVTKSEARQTAKNDKATLSVTKVDKHLGRPNARKWDSQTISQFVEDYTAIPPEELLKKYRLRTLNTATKYYHKFSKNKSL